MGCHGESTASVDDSNDLDIDEPLAKNQKVMISLPDDSL
jgi:hypothetical protein